MVLYLVVIPHPLLHDVIHSFVLLPSTHNSLPQINPQSNKVQAVVQNYLLQYSHPSVKKTILTSSPSQIPHAPKSSQTQPPISTPSLILPLAPTVVLIETSTITAVV
jgi:hypothetical protein